MKTSLKNIVPIAIAAGFSCIASLPAQAATWYWTGASDGTWANTTRWNSQADGLGQTMSAAGASFSVLDIYDTNGTTKILGDSGMANRNFPGGTLRLNGGFLGLKPGTNDVVIPYSAVSVIVASVGSKIDLLGASKAGASFTITNLDMQGQLTLMNSYVSGTGGPDDFTLNATNVTGGGLFEFKGVASSTMRVSITDQELTNSFRVDNTLLTLNSSITTSGELTLLAGSSIALNGNSISFTGITDGTNSLADGTYTTASLASTPFAGFFSGTGNIIVTSTIPEPSSAALLFGAGAGMLVIVTRRGGRDRK